MIFSSIPFLYYFLPIVLLLYYLMPWKLKNTVLLVSSLVFYAWGEPKYILLMAVSIFLGYVFGILIEKFQDTKWSKMFMVMSVVTGIGLLGYFKYADFFISNFNKVTGLSIDLLKIALPIGISFYTFQTLSYTVDVYRKNTKAQKNIINLATYVALFPQLIAGPIVRYVDVAVQLEERQIGAQKIYEGVRRFLFGLSKKVLIANILGELVAIFRSSQDKSVLFYWIYGISFALQIYFDFSGYSDMAIGLGKMFGFDFLENFDYPFISKSVTEFWRRWHMSLGSWFRDYVYIPMGGNRVSTLRWLFNIAVVWMLTGFWHGADWNFILWGVFFAVLLIVEKLWLSKLLKKAPDVLGHIYVLFAVLLSFTLFNAESLIGAVDDIKGILGLSGIPFISFDTIYYLRSYASVLIVGIIGSTPFLTNMMGRLKKKRTSGKVLSILEPILLAVFLLLTTAYLVDGSFNPFLYFRF